MRRRMFAVLIALVFWATGSAYAAGPTYYLALGDSLSRGIQPGRDGGLVETQQGYVDDLFAFYRVRHPGLRLAKLGCSGETTTTMIAGGSCSYGSGSQLAEAVEFLQTHHVGLVTLTIGGNNVDQCIGTAGIDEACVLNGLGAVAAELPRIVGALRTAAGPGVPIVAMNYYDPFLALWRLGAAGQLLANESFQATVVFNGLLESVYQQFRVPVADVAKAFLYGRLHAGTGVRSAVERVGDAGVDLDGRDAAGRPEHSSERVRLRRHCRRVRQNDRNLLTRRLTLTSHLDESEREHTHDDRKNPEHWFLLGALVSGADDGRRELQEHQQSRAYIEL